MSLRNDISRLARELEDEANACFDLWTCLPSYREAKKRHGDYVDEYRPDVAEVMREAAIFIACLNPGGGKIAAADEHLMYECPCGEMHRDGKSTDEASQEERGDDTP